MTRLQEVTEARRDAEDFKYDERRRDSHLKKPLKDIVYAVRYSAAYVNVHLAFCRVFAATNISWKFVIRQIALFLRLAS